VGGGVGSARVTRPRRASERVRAVVCFPALPQPAGRGKQQRHLAPAPPGRRRDLAAPPLPPNCRCVAAATCLVLHGPRVKAERVVRPERLALLRREGGAGSEGPGRRAAVTYGAGPTAYPTGQRRRPCRAPESRLAPARLPQGSPPQSAGSWRWSWPRRMPWRPSGGWGGAGGAGRDPRFGRSAVPARTRPTVVRSRWCAMVATGEHSGHTGQGCGARHTSGRRGEVVLWPGSPRAALGLLDAGRPLPATAQRQLRGAVVARRVPGWLKSRQGSACWLPGTGRCPQREQQRHKVRVSESETRSHPVGPRHASTQPGKRSRHDASRHRAAGAIAALADDCTSCARATQLPVSPVCCGGAGRRHRRPCARCKRRTTSSVCRAPCPRRDPARLVVLPYSRTWNTAQLTSLPGRCCGAGGERLAGRADGGGRCDGRGVRGYGSHQPPLACSPPAPSCTGTGVVDAATAHRRSLAHHLRDDVSRGDARHVQRVRPRAALLHHQATVAKEAGGGCARARVCERGMVTGRRERSRQTRGSVRQVGAVIVPSPDLQRWLLRALVARHATAPPSYVPAASSLSASRNAPTLKASSSEVTSSPSTTAARRTFSITCGRGGRGRCRGGGARDGWDT
jgi:hypothetical protein